MKQACPECQGEKFVLLPRAAVDANEIVTVYVRVKCGACRGEGWLPFPGRLIV